MQPAGTAPPGMALPRTGPPGMAQTTMSAAAGATMPSQRRQRSWALPLAAVAVLAVGGVILAAVRGGAGHEVAPAGAPPPPAAPPAPVASPPDPVAAPRAPTPSPGPAPTPPVATAPVAPAARADPPAAQPSAPQPAKATLAISSDPDGAEVYRMPQGVLVGTTPLTYPVDAVAGQLVFVVKKPGYRDETIAMAADHNGDQLVKLRKSGGAPGKPARPARPTDGAPAGSDDFLTRTPAAPTGSLDPFAKPKK
jgi:hypothetical protein